MRRLSFWLIALALCCGPASLAATAPATPVPRATAPVKINAARIERTLQGFISDGRAAGVSMLVWQNGRERYFGAVGYADREARRLMGRDTLAQIWSMTKPVTGVALMQLWEAGRFGLDDPVAKYLAHGL